MGLHHPRWVRSSWQNLERVETLGRGPFCSGSGPGFCLQGLCGFRMVRFGVFTQSREDFESIGFIASLWRPPYHCVHTLVETVSFRFVGSAVWPLRRGSPRKQMSVDTLPARIPPDSSFAKRQTSYTKDFASPTQPRPHRLPRRIEGRPDLTSGYTSAGP